VGSGLPEAGSGLPEAGLGLPEAGSGLPEAGSSLPEAGSGLPEAGSGLGGGGGTYRRMYVRTDVQIPPVFYRTLFPFEAEAQNKKTNPRPSNCRPCLYAEVF